MTAQPRQARLVIRTPEGVAFSLTLAGPGARLLAFLLDLGIVGAIGSALDRVLAVAEVVSPDAAGAFRILGYFVIQVVYGILTEWRLRGQTIGKRVLGLRVIDAHGGRLDPSQIVLRNLLRVVDSLPVLYLLGGIVSVLHPRNQRLGDIAARTVVVRPGEFGVPDLDRVLGGKFNSMAAHRSLAARLRQKTPPELAAAALDALMRREDFEAESRVRVFGELRARLAELVAFPADAVENLPDEQYVRNATEILFRSR
jgi:uncharacterized RDD family membrane protein YckC